MFEPDGAPQPPRPPESPEAPPRGEGSARPVVATPSVCRARSMSASLMGRWPRCGRGRKDRGAGRGARVRGGAGWGWNRDGAIPRGRAAFADEVITAGFPDPAGLPRSAACWRPGGPVDMAILSGASANQLSWAEAGECRARPHPSRNGPPGIPIHEQHHL